MNDFERKFPLLSGVMQGAVIACTVGAVSPFTPVGTAFVTAAAVVINACLPSFGDRSNCQLLPKPKTEPSPK